MYKANDCVWYQNDGGISVGIVVGYDMISNHYYITDMYNRRKYLIKSDLIIRKRSFNDNTGFGELTELVTELASMKKKIKFLEKELKELKRKSSNHFHLDDGTPVVITFTSI